MKHLTEEELVLLYYGEDDGDETRVHLEACDDCRQAYQEVETVLDQVSLPVPQRGSEYGAEVWNRVARRLEESPRRTSWWQAIWIPQRWAAVAAVAALVVIAFVAGRFWPSQSTQQGNAPIAQKVRERILLVAVGDHLERSEMVLLELVNAKPRDRNVDISEEQERAQDLISSNRLYRQTAARSGDPATAAVLDELERVLLEVAHSPSRLSSSEFEDLRRRVEAQGILFKMRVIDSRIQPDTRRTS